jgi:hypothetical protein
LSVTRNPEHTGGTTRGTHLGLALVVISAAQLMIVLDRSNTLVTLSLVRQRIIIDSSLEGTSRFYQGKRIDRCILYTGRPASRRGYSIRPAEGLA